MAERIIPEAKSRSRLLSFINEYKDKAGSAPGSPTGSVQVNVSGSFSGSEALVWDTETGDGLGISMDDIGTTSKVHLDVNYGYLDELSADTGGGESVTFGSGTTVAGKLYYLESSGVWTETDADHASGKAGDWQLLAIALGTDPAANGMLLRGFFQLTTYLVGTWVPGQALYVSTTPGNIAAIAPSATSDFVRVVGYCCAGTTDLIYFNPSSTNVVIS